MSEILNISNGKYDQDMIDKIIDNIKNNKIIIMPSDTIYGFLSLADQENRIRKIKKRETKPFLNLISSIDMLSSLDIDKNKYSDILNKYWPGPITFIMLNNKNNTIGVRMPDDIVLKNIINSVGEPLLSTSVNYAEETYINEIDEIISEFKDQVDMVVVDKNFSPKTASSIVDISKKPFKVIREGSIVFNES